MDWEHAWQSKKNMDDYLPLQGMVIFFLIDLYQGGIFQNDYQLLILNGHGSHVTIKALEQATKIGFNMVTIW